MLEKPCKALIIATNDRFVQVGHAGTLDPMATGLVIVCIGKGTKHVDSFMAQEKEYTGEHLSSFPFPASCTFHSPTLALYPSSPSPLPPLFLPHLPL